MGMGQRDHGGLSVHLLGLSGQEEGIPGSRSPPDGAAFLISFLISTRACELSCCSSTYLRIAALLKLGDAPGQHPGQAPCSKQVQLSQATIASEGQYLEEHVMLRQELQEGHECVAN